MPLTLTVITLCIAIRDLIDMSGGGVGLYLTTELDYKLRNEFAFPDQLNIESLFIEIISVEGKNSIVGIVYMPPSQNIADFITNLNIFMAKISKENKVCYLMGDFNLNLLIVDLCYEVDYFRSHFPQYSPFERNARQTPS
jgi:hypothetical protein